MALVLRETALSESDPSDLSTPRIESTPEYQAEFDRLLAIAAKAEKALKDAQAEYDSAHVALLTHIESRHYG
jgi:hypothetical protein